MKCWLLIHPLRHFPGLFQRIPAPDATVIVGLRLNVFPGAIGPKGLLGTESPDEILSHHFFPSDSISPISARSFSPTRVHWRTRNFPSVAVGIAAIFWAVNSMIKILYPGFHSFMHQSRVAKLIPAPHCSVSSVFISETEKLLIFGSR